MRYFGTDGIRGKAYEKLTLDLARKVGEALFLLGNRTLCIARDTRESSKPLEDEIIKGATSVGINVIDFGVLTSPGLILESYFNKALGIMITASHNPYYDNGIKVINSGYKINQIDKQKIEDYIDGIINFSHPTNGTYTIGNTIYKDFLAKRMIKTNLKVLVDCANGASTYYADILNKVADCTFISNNPDGKNINNGCGATHLENLKSHIDGYDLGIAFDGDADRIMVIDKENIYDGDMLIYIFAKYFKEKDMLNKDTVVLTKMSNLGIINALNDEGINTVLTDVGDQNVLEEMLNDEYSLGGENSGHIITPITITGDGLLNAILLLSILFEKNKTIKELTDGISLYYDKMININVIDKSIINNDFLQNRVKEIESSFGKYGKIILRASGTEELIRVSVMHKDKQTMEKYLMELVDIVNGLNRR